MRVYPDAVAVIYKVERKAPFDRLVDARLTVPGTVIVASELTRMECRVMPLRHGDSALLAAFDTFFASVVMVDLTTAVFDKAAEIRARHPTIKTPDALH